MEKWESYRTRAIPVDLRFQPDPRTAALRRLDALRELMRMELPDRKSDLLFPLNESPANPSDNPDFLESRPSLWRAYIRRARQQIIAKYGLPLTAVDDWKDDTRWTPLHQNAECLYLILSAIHENDTTGLEFFSENEIGDADGDGMPEILDPWGNPIRFLRWAPGFRSDIQKGDLAPTIIDDAGPGNGDAFDPLKLDPRWHDTVPDNDPFLLFPLIFSLGRDKSIDITEDFASPLSYRNPPVAPSPYVNRQNDPYVRYSDATQVGKPADLNVDGVDGSLDNITNHFIEVR